MADVNSMEKEIRSVVSECPNPSGVIEWSRLHAENIDTGTEVEERLWEIANTHDVDYSTVVSNYHSKVSKESSGFLPF